MSDRTHGGDPIPGILLQDRHHLRPARANLGSYSPIRHKRGAEDALPEAESGRDTKCLRRELFEQNNSKAKDLKQNGLKQEDLKQEKDPYPGD